MSKAEDNFKKYQATLNGIMMTLAAEGFKLLEEEERAKNPVVKKPSPPSVLENALGAMDKNPYINARAQVLKNMTPKERSEIERMESTGKLENSVYQDFVRKVSKMGDLYSK